MTKKGLTCRSLISYQRRACEANGRVGLTSRRLSPQARLTFTDGHINTLISADSAYLDLMYPSSVELPTHLPVILVACVLLIVNLGVSALCGIGVLVFFSPVQGVCKSQITSQIQCAFMYSSLAWAYQQNMRLRRKQVEKVDKRVQLLGEVVNAIRAVKLYAYETYFANKISAMRSNEHQTLRQIALCRSTVNSSFYALPILASIGKATSVSEPHIKATLSP
jgi:ATP-binding cassette subfamily C (CFTR/MRP) protein 1